eukprot:7034249-Prymnesium_polylepis.1
MGCRGGGVLVYAFAPYSQAGLPPSAMPRSTHEVERIAQAVVVAVVGWRGASRAFERVGGRASRFEGWRRPARVAGCTPHRPALTPRPWHAGRTHPRARWHRTSRRPKTTPRRIGATHTTAAAPERAPSGSAHTRAHLPSLHPR